MKIIKPSIEILTLINGSEILRLIEKIGRVCYKSEDKITDESASKFVRNIIKRGHESVIEHVSVTVKVICDRGVSHEIVRHRIGSYSQESTRYCNYSTEKFGNGLTFIEPCFWEDRNTVEDRSYHNDYWKHKVWKDNLYKVEAGYLKLIEFGATPQEARSVLPNSLKTEIVMTLNMRSWRNFFKLRCAKAAHPQMREVANMIYEQFNKELPEIFEGLLDG